MKLSEITKLIYNKGSTYHFVIKDKYKKSSISYLQEVEYDELSNSVRILPKHPQNDITLLVNRIELSIPTIDECQKVSCWLNY